MSDIRRILIVDDNPAIHEDFRKVLERDGAPASLRELEAEMFGTSSDDTSTGLRYELISAHQGEEALARVEESMREERPFMLAFVDMRMPPGWDGLETIERIWRVDPRIQVVICTAYSEHPRDEMTRRLGMTHQLLILKKPFDSAEVEQLSAALSEKWLRTREAELTLSSMERQVEQRTSELRCSEERFALAAQGSNDGLWDWNIETGEVYFSKRWWAIMGRSSAPTDKPATMQTWFERVHPFDREGFEDAVRAHVEGGTTHLEHEHRVLGADDVYTWVLCRGAAVRGERGTTRLSGSLTDISRQKMTEEELRRGAYYDRLTGLPNRTLLCASIERLMRSGTPYTVLFLDFDRFKYVNDSMGHAAGDQLLVEIAQRLTATMRRASETTLKGSPFSVARMGGDEFVVLLENCKEASAAEEVARALQNAFSSAFRIHEMEVFSTASIGIATSRASGSAPDEILRDADTAMYCAKAGGRARVAVFDASMRERVIAKLALETDLRHAVSRNELYLEYQPILCASSARVLAMEALLRWKHPRLGLVSPDRFVPIAEETGQIVGIGEWVVRQACEQLALWRSRSSAFEDVSVSVNISTRQLVDPGLPDLIVSSLNVRSLRRGSLLIEVTESAVMDDLDSSVSVLRRLKTLGVDAYMDDFGTGYSSLSCLKQLPLAGLKLDRSFVVQAGRTGDMPAIIHAVVTLARNLRMSVVAEGVENEEQLATVIALDCDQVQGFFFAKPMRGESALGWMELQKSATPRDRWAA
ncbi:MAG: EAL domain-containing protein [Phycisphaerales bacterium]